MATIHDLSLETRRAPEGERSAELMELNRKYMKETERAPKRPTKGQVGSSSPHVARAAHATQRHHRLLRNSCSSSSSGLSARNTRNTRANIHGSGQYLLGVINDILDMSKIEAGQFSIDRESIDLCPLIRETVRVVALQAAEKVDHLGDQDP